jgi:hypothetical protein
VCSTSYDGYARNEELLSRFITEAADTVALTTAAPGSTGDGMLMAEAIGATYYEELGSSVLEAPYSLHCHVVD